LKTCVSTRKFASMEQRLNEEGDSQPRHFLRNIAHFGPKLRPGNGEEGQVA